MSKAEWALGGAWWRERIWSKHTLWRYIYINRGEVGDEKKRVFSTQTRTNQKQKVRKMENGGCGKGGRGIFHLWKGRVCSWVKWWLTSHFRGVLRTLQHYEHWPAVGKFPAGIHLYFSMSCAMRIQCHQKLGLTSRLWEVTSNTEHSLEFWGPMGTRWSATQKDVTDSPYWWF